MRVDRDMEVEARKGHVSVQQRDRGYGAVRRFRDLKADLQARRRHEVTNDQVLDLLLDVYALHAEREGREAVAAAAGRSAAIDGGEPR